MRDESASAAATTFDELQKLKLSLDISIMEQIFGPLVNLCW